MISIIVPCYNGYNYIHKCLRSLEKQKVKDFELIIIDDNSNDGIYEKLYNEKEIYSYNIVIISNDENIGPSRSRERGIKYANGEIICFCDCDDWYEKDFIEIILNQYANTNFDLCMFNNYLVSGEKKKAIDINKELKKCKTKKELIAYAPMSLCRIAVKKELLDKVDFFDLYYAEDGIVLMQLLLYANNIVFDDHYFYDYCLHDDSAHTKPKPRCFFDAIKSVIFAEKILGDEYKEELEFIFIKNVIYGGVISAIKSGIEIGIIKSQIKELNNKYPDYIHNKYIFLLNFAKKVFINSVYHERYLFCKLLTVIHSLLV